MNQVGETKTFSLSVTPPSTAGIYAYIWKFWDNTVAVTKVPTVDKVLNIGGDPGNSRKLFFTCQPVKEDGQSVLITGEVVVNNPPSVIPSPEITNNDDFFPYPTQIRISAYDVENDGLSFLYYNSLGTPLGGGSTVSIGTITGTWNGTAGLYQGYQNTFTGTITDETTITLKIVDSSLGTRVVDFDFFGDTPPPPTIGVTADAEALTTDATSIPDQRIGPGQIVNFTVYASDPVSPNFRFVWSFWGSNGWNGNTFSNGTSAPTADGSVRNTLSKDIASESGGSKTVLVSVTNLNSGLSTEIPVYVNLIANSTGTTCTFTVTNENGIAQSGAVPAGTKLFYTATVVDPQNDVVTYKWTIAQPVSPNPLRLWGREIMLDTTGFASLSEILVTLLSVDRMDGQATFTAPTITIS
jgi:hypothetical protein